MVAGISLAWRTNERPIPGALRTWHVVAFVRLSALLRRRLRLFSFYVLFLLSLYGRHRHCVCVFSCLCVSVKRRREGERGKAHMMHLRRLRFFKGHKVTRTDRQTDKQTDRRTKQKDRQTDRQTERSLKHNSEPTRLGMNSYADLSLKKKTTDKHQTHNATQYPHTTTPP